jgi:hypothetical protein
MRTKKEMKEAYQDMKFPAGVYQIKNVNNNKVLVDCSSNLTAIWNRHQAQLRFGSHRNADLQRDWNELGQENFVFEILGEINDEGLTARKKEQELTTLKELWVEKIKKSNQSTYNQ